MVAAQLKLFSFLTRQFKIVNISQTLDTYLLDLKLCEVYFELGQLLHILEYHSSESTIDSFDLKLL